MRILVVSDSHGNIDAVKAALEKEPSEAVIHLGDGAREAIRLQAEYPDREWHIVCGNCDIGAAAPPKKRITVGGKRLYLTHGHGERVKSGLLMLSLTARENEVDAALYGHTHIAATDYDGGILLLNPGSIGQNGSYAVLTVENGELRSSMARL